MTTKTSKYLDQAKTLLENHTNKPMSSQIREEKAIELAALILREASRTQTHKEKKQQKEIARMLKDPRGKIFTLWMTDNAFRSKKSKRVADQLIYLLEQFGIPRFLFFKKRFQLKFFKIFGKSFHFILSPLAKRALRKNILHMILPKEKNALQKHIANRQKENFHLNFNFLGEKVLGEEESKRQLNTYLEALDQKDIQCLSIKISTLFSQIHFIDWNKTIAILSERLTKLYRKAKDKDKFIYLDMEQYQDLYLTKELFIAILEKEEFLDFSSGIALQAYLPDSYSILQEITDWAIKRKEQGGAWIKVRIVKGANLAMERVESSLQQWPQPTFQTKSEADANFKKMILYGCKPRHIEAVYLGIATHNLFDLAYAMLLCAENNLLKEINFEMLEGMANHLSRIVQQLTKNVLLYCPVAEKKDFQNAISYFIRRLDENTSSENFLHHSFALKVKSKTWKEQAELFSKACQKINTLSQEPRRTQNRFDPPKLLPIDHPFQNEPDTDFSLYQNQKWAHEGIEEWKNTTFETIPLVINKKTIQREQKGEGIDPSYPHQTAYQYSLATWHDIDQALNTAKENENDWQKLSLEERCQYIRKIAQKIRQNRKELIGVMMKDGGKSILEADKEVSEAIDFAEYYLRSRIQISHFKEIETTPLGTILVAPPWNFPISIPSGGIIAALVTGNCVLFKPAPEAVLSGWVLVNLFWEAGISRDVLQFFNCVDDPIGSQLIRDTRLNGVILTGAASTAQHFLKIRPNLPLFAETGGKNPMIITAMADRNLAIKDLVQSAFGHSGQKCSAASLLIAEAEVYDDPDFNKQLKDAVESLPLGTCWEISSKIVPLIRPPNENLLKGLTTLERGEKWLVEPKQDPNNPHLWTPGVKLGVKKESFMHQTELFGPLLGVMRAKDLNEAIELANKTPYGLTSGIHTLDPREIDQWIKKITTGNGYVNRSITGAIVERQPFGGCKASSFGHGSKTGGPNYIQQFLHKKQIDIPKDKAPVSIAINALTEFLNQIDLTPEELGAWFATTANYAYWAKYFLRDHDPAKVLGQDNLLRYLPRTHMAFRLQKEDKPLDIFLILAASFACHTHLEVTYDPSQMPLQIDDRWKQIVQEASFTEEANSHFLERIQWGAFDRIRFASPPPQEIQQIAVESATYLSIEPILYTGRWELLHYLREMTLSIDYHRYGNLGAREGEIRTPLE